MPQDHDALDRPMARRNVTSLTEALIEPLARLRNEVDRIFEEFPTRWPSSRFNLPSGLLVPAVEMTEAKEAFKLDVEVPGMEATDIEMHVHDGAIYISGEKKDRKDEDQKGYAYSERSFGTFERRIELPANADKKEIKAKIRNGVLEITVPKLAGSETERKKIQIDTA
jgi:HSP20 family protein